uniref:Putative secreted protein n=1 Tax=Xenopsylla cheopis TaxID=163159 RepID=A0A6M2DYA7_XENCH
MLLYVLNPHRQQQMLLIPVWLTGLIQTIDVKVPDIMEANIMEANIMVLNQVAIKVTNLLLKYLLEWSTNVLEVIVS